MPKSTFWVLILHGFGRKNMKNKITAYLFIMGAAFCWGTGGVFTKMITPYGYTSLEMAFLKTLVGLIILSAIGIFKNREMFKLEKARDLINIAGMSIFGYVLYAVAFIMTVNEMGVGMAAAMLYTKCIFVMIFSRFLFGSRITAQKAGAMLLTVLGCVCFSGIFSETETVFTAKGVFWGITSGIGFAAYDVLGKKSLDKYSTETVNFYTFLISTAVTAVLANPAVSIAKVAQTNTLLLIVIYGVMVAALPYFLYNIGLSRVDASTASVVSTFELLTAAAAGVMLYNEELTVFKVLGIIFIIGAVCVLNLPRNKVEK